LINGIQVETCKEFDLEYIIQALSENSSSLQKVEKEKWEEWANELRNLWNTA